MSCPTRAFIMHKRDIIFWPIQWNITNKIVERCHEPSTMYKPLWIALHDEVYYTAPPPLSYSSMCSLMSCPTRAFIMHKRDNSQPIQWNIILFWMVMSWGVLRCIIQFTLQPSTPTHLCAVQCPAPQELLCTKYSCSVLPFCYLGTFDFPCAKYYTAQYSLQYSPPLLLIYVLSNVLPHKGFFYAQNTLALCSPFAT